MNRYFYSAVIVASLLSVFGVDSLDGREPPIYYVPERSSIVELDLITGRTKTISERKDNALVLLDQRNGVLLGVEFGGREQSRMVGISAKSGKVLWDLHTDSESWEHFFDYYVHGRDWCFSIPHRDFSKPPTGGHTSFCGLAGDNLAGIDVQTGAVRWRIAPPSHTDDFFAWQSIFQLRDHVAAVIHGRVMIVNRTNGKIMLELKPKRSRSFYQIGQPVETDEYILLVFDSGEYKELIRWNKRSGKLEERVKPQVSLSQFIAATDKLVLTNQGSIARDIQTLDRVLWRRTKAAWSDPGARPVVWGQYLVTRSNDMPTVDLRDGSAFSLFHQPLHREVHFSNYLWAVQDDTLYTVSSAGILGWDKKQLASRGSPTMGRSVWTPSAEATESKRAPAFVDCLMDNGKAYLVLVHEWDPVF